MIMVLSRNFTLREMIKSETATRLDIANEPDYIAVANLGRLARAVLQPVRDYFGHAVKVNSGYRSPELNKYIGGSANSDHCRGMAADIEVFGVANYETAKWIRDHLEFTQLILEGYTPGLPGSGWVHVSYNPDDLKKEVLTAQFVKGKAVYTQGLVY